MMSLPWLHVCGISRQLNHFRALLHDVSSWLFQYFGTYLVSRAVRSELRHDAYLTFDCSKGRTGAFTVP